MQPAAPLGMEDEGCMEEGCTEAMRMSAVWNPVETDDEAEGGDRDAAAGEDPEPMPLHSITVSSLGGSETSAPLHAFVGSSGRPSGTAPSMQAASFPPQSHSSAHNQEGHPAQQQQQQLRVSQVLVLQQRRRTSGGSDGSGRADLDDQDTRSQPSASRLLVSQPSISRLVSDHHTQSASAVPAMRLTPASTENTAGMEDNAAAAATGNCAHIEVQQQHQLADDDGGGRQQGELEQEDADMEDPSESEDDGSWPVDPPAAAAPDEDRRYGVNVMGPAVPHQSDPVDPSGLSAPPHELSYSGAAREPQVRARQPLKPPQLPAQPLGSSTDSLPWVQQPHPDAMPPPPPLPPALMPPMDARQSYPASAGPSLETGIGMGQGQQLPVRMSGILQQLHELLSQQQQEPEAEPGPAAAVSEQLPMQPQAAAASGRLPFPLEAAVSGQLPMVPQAAVASEQLPMVPQAVAASEHLPFPPEAAVVKAAIRVPEPSAAAAASGRWLPMQDISNNGQPPAIPQHPHKVPPKGDVPKDGQWGGGAEGEGRGEDLLGDFLRPDASFASSTGIGDDEDRGVRVDRAEGLQGRDDSPAGLRGSIFVVPDNNAIGGGGVSHAGPGSRGSLLVVPASGLSLQLDASAMRELMQQVGS